VELNIVADQQTLLAQQIDLLVAGQSDMP